MGKSTIKGYLEDLVHPSYDCYPLVNVYKKKDGQNTFFEGYQWDVKGILMGRLFTI